MILKRPKELSFLDAHSAFTVAEFQEHYRKLGRDEASARHALDYYVRQGRIGALRRGLYVRRSWVDPWLIASKIAPDVIISHEAALSFHGFLGVGNSLTFMTQQRLKSFDYNEVVYRPFRVTPARLEFTDTTSVEREGQFIQVQRLENALVDCLAELELAPDFDTLMQVFRDTKLASDPATMATLALRRKSPLLVSRLGFVLLCARPNDVPDAVIGKLERHMLPRPDYFRRTERTDEDEILGRWNLILTPEQRKHWRK